MIVADTNVIAYLWISGEKTILARRTLERDSEWVAPYLWRSEFRNVLALHLRRQFISENLAHRVVEAAEAQFRGREYFVPAHEVLQCVSRSRCSAYDCEFVALAQKLGVSLVTNDELIVAEFPGIAVGLGQFAVVQP